MTQKLLILLFFFGSFVMKSQNLVWKTNLNDAIAISNEQKKPLLIYFTAAGVSQKFEDDIFKTPDFAVWSRDNVILLKLDLSNTTISDAEREQNVKIRNAFGTEELPQVCLALASIKKMKTTFNALGKVPYNSGGVRAWIIEANAILRPE
ncbi:MULTISPECIES: thioredoxin family protein [Flavobacterium]|uniref:Thioredoxin family protein n=2 Tax=Flavobacterium TaxID=237 RepID=A0A941AYA3_9FLAO|nr:MULTISPECIES: thioredoxin family protein [Flavobacterium]MBP4139121.1 thioredoxin family protein [Flavobacterium geliluteum]MDX6181317.1 thioredoxin family protein [Flavobacterium sp. Fl-33]MDX6184918.1 thioredoxin family protein [Flavobacterium sp. Fl-77]UFH40011.1 thioredoxin family protein [Flavobacterium sp. F-70]